MRKKEKYAKSKWILRYLFCCCSNLSNDDKISSRPGWILEARVPERLVGVNPGLKFVPFLYFTFPMHCLGEHFLLSLLYLVLKAQHYL